jgi:hypothetical protein
MSKFTQRNRHEPLNNPKGDAVTYCVSFRRWISKGSLLQKIVQVKFHMWVVLGAVGATGPRCYIICE